LAAGEAGEVYAASDYLAAGYIGDPVKTRDRFTPHGFRTGDVGRLDERGLLWLKGRNDDVFKCSGQKIDAAVIADALIRSGLVRDAAVVGVPDETLGAVPHALVVTDSLDRGTIMAYARQHLPPNHVPRRLIGVDAIPRTGSGKIDRAAVRALIIGSP
jgi:O-succinylbenzoic acid--CoA ligase